MAAPVSPVSFARMPRPPGRGRGRSGRRCPPAPTSVPRRSVRTTRPSPEGVRAHRRTVRRAASGPGGGRRRPRGAPRSPRPSKWPGRPAAVRNRSARHATADMGVPRAACRGGQGRYRDEHEAHRSAAPDDHFGEHVDENRGRRQPPHPAARGRGRSSGRRFRPVMVRPGVRARRGRTQRSPRCRAPSCRVSFGGLPGAARHRCGWAGGCGVAATCR
jgi:hypothetical protein